MDNRVVTWTENQWNFMERLAVAMTLHFPSSHIS